MTITEKYLRDNIAKSFYSVHDGIKSEKYSHYWLCGGRGSTKSSFVSIEMICGIMKNPDANGAVIRKVGAYLRDSVFAQLRWATEILGVSDLWQFKLSPLEMVFTQTGQKILFRGADEPQKLKSTKTSKGYIRYIWYEELSEFYGMEEIRSINQSLMRGGEKFDVFYTYNPPASLKNWVNLEAQTERADRLTHKSSYLDVPPKWLGEQFIIEAEHLKKTNPTLYEHEYLGKITGTGGEVFRNLTIRNISAKERRRFDKIRLGIDFGYAADPFVYIVCHYDRGHKKLYIYDEIYKTGLSNYEAAKKIKKLGTYNQVIICDSAEPKSIRELRDMGLRVSGAKKGPDSVAYGIKFLQSLEEIVIDPVSCPNAAREFSGYEIEKDSYGLLKAHFPDRDNHTIDAARYALEQDISFKKARVIKRAAFGF